MCGELIVLRDDTDPVPGTVMAVYQAWTALANDEVRIPVTEGGAITGVYEPGNDISGTTGDTSTNYTLNDVEVTTSGFTSPTVFFVGSTQYELSIQLCAAEGSVAGRVKADCPAPNTGLLGVTVDAFLKGDGDLVASTVTDADGTYQLDNLAAGDYMMTIVTPLGYSAVADEIDVTITGGDIIDADFDLSCLNITPSQRSIGFWKHQVGVAAGGKGNAQIDGATLCDYLDLIEAHFNSNAINEVVIYVPPASGLCSDKLAVAKELLNLKGNVGMTARAKQQLMALLLNVASEKLSLREVISDDGATVSQAITYCDNLIDDAAGDHETAKTIADRINNAKVVSAGVIPLSTEDIAYSPRRGGNPAQKFFLGQNYPNPFNPTMRFEFVLEREGLVVLSIHDISGRLVRTLVSRAMSSGTYLEEWDGRDASGNAVASGVYFYRLTAGNRVLTRKAVLLK